jgi:hypothetical protein
MYFLFFHSYDFVTVSPLSSKTINCYNITSVILIINFLSLMISWIIFILHRKIFPIHHTYIYSLVSYLFMKQDQMILTCNSAVASLMLSQFFFIVSIMCMDFKKKIAVGNLRIKYQSYIFFSPLSMFHLLGEFKSHLSLFIFNKVAKY